MEESPKDEAPEAGAKKTALRVGWSTVGIGLGAAIVAAAIGAYNADSAMTGAIVLQRVASLIMLVGLVVVLAAHRAKRWRGRM